MSTLCAPQSLHRSLVLSLLVVFGFASLAGTFACSSNEGAATLPDADPITPPSLDPETIIEGLAAPFALAVSAGRLYVSDVSDATIKSCELTACASTLTTFVAGQVVATNTLRAHGETIVWATGEAVVTCPTSDCASPTPLHVGDLRVTALEVDDEGTVFFADRNTKTISRVSLGGGAVEQIAPDVDDVRGLVVRDDAVTFTTYGGASTTVMLAKILRCPRNGCAGAPELLSGASEGLGAVGVVVDAAHVTWAEVGRIARCPVAGCSGAPELLFEGTSSFERLVEPATGVLVWSAYSSGLHACVSSACSATHVSVEDGPTIQAFALDDTHLYWVASSQPGNGLVARTPR